MSLTLDDLLPGWSPGTAVSRETLMLLQQFDRRRQIYKRLLERAQNEPRVLRSCGPLLRALLELEMDYRSQEEPDPADEGDGFEHIYACALLLFDLGVPDDALRLWEAKQLNMDVGIGLDIQFLVGAGVDATLHLLSSQGSEAAREAADQLEERLAAGEFDDLTNWRRSKYEYFLW